MDFEFLARAVVALLVITAPPDPVKVLLFNTAIERKGTPRLVGATTIAVNVVLILGAVAFIGAQALDLLGINLDAFTAVGGLVAAGMGFEMLYAGEPSKAQGQKQEREGPQEDTGLLMPLTIPLIVGPGAIATTVTLSTSRADGWYIALIAVGVVALVAFLSFFVLGSVFSRLSDRAAAVLMRIGGLLLATIGTQMLLGGLKNFFAA